jgi:uncharacterized protein (DUF433 family)/DNA-binding transcriptional MerR regulator
MKSSTQRSTNSGATTNAEQSLVGIGLYTVSEAERLVDVRSQTIRRWLRGYRTRSQTTGREMPPVWRAEVLPINNVLGLSFLDLMELRFVRAFRRHGVSLTIIRKTAERAEELFQRDHPFTRARFRTDGRDIFAEIVEKEGGRKLLDLSRNQYAFHQMLDSSLYASLEISLGDDVLRWYPLFPKKSVIVDPQWAFGRPITAKGGVPTEVLAKAVEVEGSVNRVARWYEVPVQAVRAAVEFEDKLAA